MEFSLELLEHGEVLYPLIWSPLGFPF
jgi:hypothetical protein